jgi:hypothetical protein
VGARKDVERCVNWRLNYLIDTDITNDVSSTVGRLARSMI